MDYSTVWFEISDWWLQTGIDGIIYIDAHIIFAPLLAASLVLITKLYKRYKR